MFSFFKSKKSSKNSTNDNRTSSYSAESIGDSIKDKAEDIAGAASDKFNEAKDAIADNVEDIKDSSQENNAQDKEDANETKVEKSDSTTGDILEDNEDISNSMDRLRGDFSPEKDAYEEAQKSPDKEDDSFSNDNFSSEDDERTVDTSSEDEDSLNEDNSEEDKDLDEKTPEVNDSEDAKEDTESLEEDNAEENTLEEDNAEENNDVEKVIVDEPGLEDLELEGKGVLVKGSEKHDFRGFLEDDEEEDNIVEEDDNDYVAPLPPGASPVSLPDASNVPLPPEEENTQDDVNADEHDVTEEDFDFLVSDKEDEHPEETQDGSAEFEPSTEERGDANEVPDDEDFAFIDSEEAFDEEVEKGQDPEDFSKDSVVEVAEDNGYSQVDEDDNSNDVIDDLDSYFSPLENEDDSSSDEAEREDDVFDDLEKDDLDRGPAEGEIDNPDAKSNEDNTVLVNGETSSQPQGAAINVTPIVFEDCEDNDTFTKEISLVLDNREVYVFDFTENKSGHAILPSTVKEQFVELPEGDISPLDARTILNEAYKHPGCAVVVVGPEVITSEISKKFDKGSQGYNLIVDTVNNLLREASDNDVDVVTIGAKTNDLLDDIIEAASL